MLRRLTAATILGFALVGAGLTQASADAPYTTLRWPSATAMPKLAPPPAPPPAVLERAPSVIKYQTSEMRRPGSAATCADGRACVVCVAACDRAPPSIVQSLVVRPTGAAVAASSETNADGIADNAPRFARSEWAGITCGSESGCSVSGVSAPSSRTKDIDVRMTIITPVGGSTSRYIDR